MMDEDHLLDEIARILASPMPRRQALKRIAGGLAGAAMAAFLAPGRASAAPKECKKDGDCGGGEYCCNKKICCTSTDQCCGPGANALCCPAGRVCCGNGANTVCCGQGQTCDGKKCAGNVSPSR